jgi:hypothetical protein
LSWASPIWQTSSVRRFSRQDMVGAIWDRRLAFGNLTWFLKTFTWFKEDSPACPSRRQWNLIWQWLSGTLSPQYNGNLSPSLFQDRPDVTRELETRLPVLKDLNIAVALVNWLGVEPGLFTPEQKERWCRECTALEAEQMIEMPYETVSYWRARLEFEQGTRRATKTEYLFREGTGPWRVEQAAIPLVSPDEFPFAQRIPDWTANEWTPERTLQKLSRCATQYGMDRSDRSQNSVN